MSSSTRKRTSRSRSITPRRAPAGVPTGPVRGRRLRSLFVLLGAAALATGVWTPPVVRAGRDDGRAVARRGAVALGSNPSRAAARHRRLHAGAALVGGQALREHGTVRPLRPAASGSGDRRRRAAGRHLARLLRRGAGAGGRPADHADLEGAAGVRLRSRALRRTADVPVRRRGLGPVQRRQPAGHEQRVRTG